MVNCYMYIISGSDQSNRRQFQLYGIRQCYPDKLARAFYKL